MNVPADLLYTKDHEWAKIEGDTVTIGITEYAQGELGDIVFVELPKKGADVSQGKSFGTIEAVKAVSDLFAPMSGKISEINSTLESAPEKINNSPFGDGWMVKIKMSDPGEKKNLLSAADYGKLISKE
ncbi:MAG: glycine cleavage system protein GcvH [bacterium]|nr:glycine cleavage system protein GcvH [bacterium]